MAQPFNFPPHITPHLIAVKKHPRARRRRILMWAARCNRINAAKLVGEIEIKDQPRYDAYQKVAQEQEDAAQWALALAFGKPLPKKRQHPQQARW
jgi:hypothetical protein